MFNEQEEYKEIFEPEKESWKDKLFDAVPCWLYEFYTEYLTYKLWKRRIRFFFQRRIRGFDDSETWNLDVTFLNWLYPRFKRFIELNGGYPMDRKTFEEWDNELKYREEQLKMLVDYGAFDFPYGKEWDKEKHDNNTGYWNCANDFMKWYSENVFHLWW